jgi:hypothetical protein
MIFERRTGRGESVGPSRGKYNVSQPRARRPEKRGGSHRAAGDALALLALLTIALAGCIGPVALHQAVLGYDKTVHRLESEMLLLNIARIHQNLPDHYTVTSAITATFDYRSSVGIGAELPGFDTGRDKLFFNAGATAAENPTLSIVPVQGEEFTRRILAPMEEEKFGFLVFQGAPIDMVMRLMADGIEVQKDDGTFDRFILNRPAAPEEYQEFRRRALHLHWLNENRELFVGTINFEEGVRARLAEGPSAGDFARALEKGYRWRALGGYEYELTRGVTGRVAVTNYDPRTLSNTERATLNARAAANPKNFVLVDIRPGFPGGDYPLFGAIKLRSLNAVLRFLAQGICDHPEFDVSPDLCTGAIKRNPRRALAVDVTNTIQDNFLQAEFGGKYYFVPDTSWDRDAFVILYKLFQMTVTGVSAAGVPITISK